MSYPFPPDIQEQIDELMAIGAFSTEEDVLRHAISAYVAQRNDLAAVAASLEDYDKGERGIPARESLAAIRKQLRSNAKS